MRIALIGCTVNPRAGGMGRALYDHAVALAEAEQEVAVYALDSIAAPGAPLQNDGFAVGALRYFFSIGKGAWGMRFNPSLDSYDVVHAHLPFFGVGETVMLSEAKHPVLQRDPSAAQRPQDDKKTRRFFVTYHMDAIGTGLKKVYFNWWYRRRFKKILDACDAIAVTSRAYARDSWLARAGVDVEKCEEILLRVDTGIFTPHPNPLPQGERGKYLLFVGALDRAHYFKGLSLLLRASARVSDARLVVVGGGELLSQYKKEAARLGIAERVTFTGGVSDEELVRWYAGARAEILPSTDRSEAFGIVLIEAMACGTPVIASDLPGVRAVVERVNGGSLVPPGDEQALARALQNAWDTPWSADERIALAERAAVVYSRATLAEQLIRWYTNVHVPS